MRTAVLAVSLLAAGCNLTVDYGGTRYRCDEGMACPAGQVCVGGFCEDPVEPITDAAAPGPDAAPDAAVPEAVPWWDTDWPFRRRITVRNVSGELLETDFEVGFPIDVEALIGDATPYASVRVMHYNDQTGDWYQMARVIETTAGAEERVWIGLEEDLTPGEAVDHYWLYYGHLNPPADVLNDPEDVFTFFAPFSATDLDLEFTCNASVSGGDLELGPIDPLCAGAHLRTFDEWGPGHAVDFQLQVPLWDNRFWGGFHRENDFADDEPWILWISRGPSQAMTPEFLAYATGVTTTYVGPEVSVGGTRNLWSVERFAQKIVFLHEHQVIDTHELAAPFLAPLQARLTCEASEPIYFDMLRVRRASDPPPEVTLGPEETAP